MTNDSFWHGQFSSLKETFIFLNIKYQNNYLSAFYEKPKYWLQIRMINIYINIGTISQSVCHILSVHFPIKFGRIEKLWQRLKDQELPAGPRILGALAT